MAVDNPQDVRNMLSENSDEAYIELVTLVAPGFPNAYLALNSEDVVSRGNTYKAAYFMPPNLKKTGEELPTARIGFGNVDRSLVDVIRTVEPPVHVISELVPMSRPDEVVDGPYNFTLRQVDYDVLNIVGTLGFEEILNERFPYGTYNPAEFPAVFA